MNNEVKKKLLILWSPLADYMVQCFRTLQSQKQLDIYLIYCKGDVNAPYADFDLSFCKKVFLLEPNKNENELFQFCSNLFPDSVFMTSWNYPLYMKITKNLRKKGTYVVSTFDGQWQATIKQRLGIIVSPFFLKPSIDNFFVPGDRQAVFARKLGYPNPFLGYYSANSSLFLNKKNTFPLNFIFCGRLVPVKGIELLVKAYKVYRESVAQPWGLIICGKGELASLFENIEGVQLKGFQQSQNLRNIFEQASCLILPSFKEPWGVIIHEAALSGLLVIATHNCGATNYFVRDGQNGFIVNADYYSLLQSMIRISNLSSNQIQKMSSVSNKLGELWTETAWADYVAENVFPS